MKISQMLKREDFYTINEKTLNEYFKEGGPEKTNLYIYPELNAIVTARPSRQVIDYLLCEYSVRGSKAKQLAVRGYVQGCLKSFGLLSDKKCTVKGRVSPDVLIYPCNKKYRVFDFDRKNVDVIAKYGFDDSDLQHEIAFRKRNDLPGFVPGFVACSGNGYREAIIDGRPLARISEGFESLRDQAYAMLLEYGAHQQKHIPVNAYATELQAEIICLLQKKADNAAAVMEIAKRLVELAGSEGEVTLTFSHGDLQVGNIWVENGTNKIFIIDWETWGTRSVWYDRATLYQGLRPGDIERYLTVEVPVLERAIVLLEDVIFHLHELNSLPEDFGMEQFRQYCDGVARWVKIGA